MPTIISNSGLRVAFREFLYRLPELASPLPGFSGKPKKVPPESDVFAKYAKNVKSRHLSRRFGDACPARPGRAARQTGRPDRGRRHEATVFGTKSFQKNKSKS
jgi:hypothetical protein